jgi:hypothetical protein
MAVALPRYRFTVDQHHQVAEAGIFSPDCRVELIGRTSPRLAGARSPALVTRREYRFLRPRT